MENTPTLYYILSSLTISTIVVLMILIRNYWSGFILRLNEASLDLETEIWEDEKLQIQSAQDEPKCKNSLTGKELVFQNSGNSVVLLDFFWQDRDLLWENRLN